ncbi:MAG: alpha/beta hydrolase [Chloroflexi bacterium]|nr:alpha/beta hydrolase [Chloroflexota bacterium]
MKNQPTQIQAMLPSSTTGAAPLMDCYLPTPAQRNGVGLIIFPGGGYGGHAEHEGKGYADYFVAAGITCFVVRYRLGSANFRHPAMLEDALAALYTVRQRASEWGLDPNKIGIMGSSAGGHLTAHTLVAYDRYASDIALRPNFGILCYPVIAMTGPYCHTGSRANLLGADADEALMLDVSPERLVTAQTPPCFLWHTVEDAAVPVENSLLFATALRAHGVAFEMHIYPTGRHGLGLNTDLAWASACLRWIAEVTA